MIAHTCIQSIRTLARKKPKSLTWKTKNTGRKRTLVSSCLLRKVRLQTIKTYSFISWILHVFIIYETNNTRRRALPEITCQLPLKNVWRVRYRFREIKRLLSSLILNQVIPKYLKLFPTERKKKKNPTQKPTPSMCVRLPHKQRLTTLKHTGGGCDTNDAVVAPSAWILQINLWGLSSRRSYMLLCSYLQKKTFYLSSLVFFLSLNAL